MSYAFKIWLWEFILFGVLSLKYRICSNNSRGRLFIFRIKRGWLLNGVDYFKYCLLEVMPWIFCFIFPIKQKIITSNKTEHGHFKRSKFGFLINFRSLDRLWSVLLDQIPLQLDRKVIKERENGEKGGGGWLLEQSDYFKYFHQRGAFMGGGWLIETQLLFEEIQSINQSKLYFTVNFKKIASTNANISKGKAKTNRK